MGEELFRKQVLEQGGGRLWGELVLSQPLSARLLVLALILAVSVVLVFLASSSYARKVSVQGRLVPDQGVITVAAEQRGLLADLLVAPGDWVEEGQPLFRLQLDHTLNGTTGLTNSLQASLEQQRSQLQLQLSLQQAQLQRAEVDDAARSGLLLASLTRLQDMLQRERVLERIGRQALERATLLQQRGQLALADHEAVLVQALQQEQACAELEIQILQQQARMQELDSQQYVAMTQGQQQVQDLLLELAELEQRMARVAAEQSTLQRAPLDARVSAVHLQGGMQAALDQPLVSLLPADSLLHAELLLPGSAIGFIALNQEVILRYEAFPWQKFGMHKAHLESVMQSPEPLRAGEGVSPYYRGLARLERQSVLAFGEEQPLVAGMQFSAEVVVDERSLLEWLLEPLFSIGGRS